MFPVSLFFFTVVMILLVVVTLYVRSF